MFNKKCLDIIYQKVSEDAPLSSNFGRSILDQKCWGEPFIKTISKETSTTEILFGRDFLFGIIW